MVPFYKHQTTNRIKLLIPQGAGVPALFSDFNLNEKLLKSIEDIGFTHCTAIQEQALNFTLRGNDLFAQSQTGTGKTAAFLISIFENIFRSDYHEQALVLVPTRELAVQIEAEAKLLSLHLGYNIVALFGGVGYDQQESALRGPVDLVVGTPGRIIDLSNRGILKLKDFTMAVIDEADRMFDMGFVADIRKIISRMPHKESRQTMLFSATLDYSVKRLADEYMFEPMEITIAPEVKTVSAIDQKLYHVGGSDKFKLLMGMVKKFDAPRMIIFTNTKKMCEEIYARFKVNNIKSEFLTGDLPQKKRQRIVDQFKMHEIPVLIATDVAARGIHIDDLELVINYDIPQHSENYVHRIGRTARAGKTGTAITFACEHFVEFLEPVETFIGIKIPSQAACEEDFAEDLSAGRNWKRILSQPKEYDRKNKEKSDRNNYNQKKHPRKERTSSSESPKSPAVRVPSETVFRPIQTELSQEPKRKTYTGNPIKDRENLRNVDHRLALDSRDQSEEFNAPSRNPYDRSNRKPSTSDARRSESDKKKPTSGKPTSAKPGKRSDSKKYSHPNAPKGNSPKKGSPVKNQGAPKRSMPAKVETPVKPLGLAGRIKALFKK